MGCTVVAVGDGRAALAHAARLVAFGRFMQGEMAELRRCAAQYADVYMRVGVHSGEASGAVVGGSQMSYQVFGAVAEGAHALEALAPVSEVLVK